MSKVYLALYKGRKDGKGIKTQLLRLADWAVRKATGGIYAHCEIAIANKNGYYDCYTASLRDKGVRHKLMKLPSDKWDLIELGNTDSLRAAIINRYERTAGCRYDYLGALGVVLPLRQRSNRWFCSEWCAMALGLEQPETYSPNTLAKYFQAA